MLGYLICKYANFIFIRRCLYDFLGLLPGSPISIAGLCVISWSLYLFGSYSNINWHILSEIDVLA